MVGSVVKFMQVKVLPFLSRKRKKGKFGRLTLSKEHCFFLYKKTTHI